MIWKCTAGYRAIKKWRNCWKSDTTRKVYCFLKFGLKIEIFVKESDQVIDLPGMLFI